MNLIHLHLQRKLFIRQGKYLKFNSFVVKLFAIYKHGNMEWEW